MTVGASVSVRAAVLVCVRVCVCVFVQGDVALSSVRPTTCTHWSEFPN